MLQRYFALETTFEREGEERREYEMVRGDLQEEVGNLGKVKPFSS